MRPSSTGMRAPDMLTRTLAAFLGAATCLLLALSTADAASSAGPDVVPMAFTVVAAGPDCPRCVVINARGEFTDDTSRDFALFLAQTRLQGILPREPRKNAPRDASAPRVVVAFESVGGKVVPALVIGRRIRQLGWTTVVGRASLKADGVYFERAGCYSACSMAMLGGVQRFVAPGSKPGVHQFSPQFRDEETFTATEMNAIVRDYARQVVGVYDYVQEMGVDIGFFVATMRTPFSGMDVLSQDRWMKLGLATGLLPQADETPISTVLGAVGVATTVPGVATAPAQAPAEAVSASPSAPAVTGAWTVSRTEGSLEALFSDSSVSLSLACLRSDAARLELTFKDLGPVDIEHIRAAAFAAKRLGLGDRQIAIASVAPPGPGEQALAAMLDTRDLKALQDSDALTLAVLDRSGRPAAHVASITAQGAAKAIADAMGRCGGV